jgi:hypothetical protein
MRVIITAAVLTLTACGSSVTIAPCDAEAPADAGAAYVDATPAAPDAAASRLTAEGACLWLDALYDRGVRDGSRADCPREDCPFAPGTTCDPAGVEACALHVERSTCAGDDYAGAVRQCEEMGACAAGE